MVVEDILDLDSVSVTGQCDWDRQFRDSGLARRGNHDEAHEALRIEEQLNRWKEMLPVHLTPDDPLSPLPHVSIGLAVGHHTSILSCDGPLMACSGTQQLQ